MKDHGVAKTNNTTYLVHGIVGGVIGLTVLTANAAFQGGDEMAAAYSVLGAFAWWGLTSTRRVFVEKAKVVGPKQNLAICAFMLTLYGIALSQ